MKHAISFFIILCTIFILVACSAPSSNVENQSQHIHLLVVTVTKATCTEDGVKEWMCSECGQVLKQQVIIATGHVFGDWSTLKSANCVGEGERERVCSICGEKETQIIAVSPHSFGEWIVIKGANCTEDGNQERTCSVCGEKQTSIIKATGHAFERKVLKSATCTEKGEEEMVCSVCGEKKTETIRATGHKWKMATCTEPKICTVCQLTEGSALGHECVNGKCRRCSGVFYKIITCNGVNFRLLDGAIKLEDEYSWKEAQYIISNISITFEKTYKSYSQFYVTYDLQKLKGSKHTGCCIHYALKDEEGYVMSSGNVYSRSDMDPGDKSREEYFSFNLPHTSGDLKPGSTYTLTFGD